MDTTDLLALGLDIGTSGVRCAVLDAADAVVAESREPLPASRRAGRRVTQDPHAWWHAVQRVLDAATARVPPGRIAAIAVDGTSGTVLAADAAGEPLAPASMYDAGAQPEDAARVAAHAPADSPALGMGSSLARWLALQREWPQARRVLHQADWVAARLCGRIVGSDENNVLKFGYDLQRREWPAWLEALGVPRECLPDVTAPGTPLAPLAPGWVQRWRTAAGCIVAAGTTDGVASVLATGAEAIGDAVASLGSTLVLKQWCAAPVNAPAFGIYSHRLGDRWLAGGASNAGAAVLQEHFDIAQLDALGARIDTTRDSGLDYYPLPRPGERFPIADAALAPRVTPRPADDALFLHGLLDGLVTIEHLGLERLKALGTGPATQIFTTGGGRHLHAWMALRGRRLGVPLAPARHEEAACGAARLARRALGALTRRPGG